MAGPSKNPIAQQLQLLMSGRGFNFYDDRNKARADDLLVRQRAGGFIGEACEALTALEQQYRSAYIPPSTRENPYPPADAMAKLKEIGQTRNRLSDVETQIRSMPVPTQDKVWWQFRDERVLLEQLVGFDLQLVTASQTIAERVRAITASEWHDGTAGTALGSLIQQVEGTVRDRRQFLAIQVI